MLIDYNEQIVRKIIKAVAAIGFEIQINCMLFIPESSREEILHNIEVMLEMQEAGHVLQVNAHVLAFPGSSVFDDADYPTLTTSQTSPLNGLKYEKKTYFFPVPIIAVIARPGHSLKILMAGKRIHIISTVMKYVI